MPKHVAQDDAFLANETGRDTGDHNTLRVDHFTHHATGTIGGRHQRGRQSELIRRDLLLAAEQCITSRVRTGECDAHPADQRAKERIQPAGIGKGQAHGGIHARIACRVAEREHGDDGDDGVF